MTETLSSSNRERQAIQPPVVENAPNALQLASLDDIVGLKQRLDEDYMRTHPKASKRELDVNLHVRIDELLRERGIVDDNEDRQQHADYDFAKALYMDAVKHDQNTWLYLSEQDNTLRPRDVAFQNVLEHYAGRPAQAIDATSEPQQAEPIDTPEIPTNDSHDELSGEATDGAGTETAVLPVRGERTNLEHGSNLDEAEFIQADKHLAEMMEDYAALIAERSRSIVEGTKTGAGIEHAGNELSEMLAGMASELYADMSARGESEEDIVAFIDEFIKTSTEETLAKVEQHRMEEYNKSRPYMQKVYDTWADWSDDKRLKGGRGKKIAVMAAGGAVLGVALAPLVGAVGAGVVTGAVAVAGTRSIGRHLANGFMKKRDKRFAQAQTDEMRTDMAAIYDQNDQRIAERANVEPNGKIIPRPQDRNLDLIEFVNQRSSEYRVRNRNRVLAGTAIALSVGLLSSTAANALDDVDWKFGRLGDVDLKNPFAGTDIDASKPEVDDADVDAPDGPDVDLSDNPEWDRDGDGTRNGYDVTPDGDATVNPEALDRDGDGVRNWIDADPDDPTVTGPRTTPDTITDVDWSDFNQQARWITPGEGGFQTLQEMGIPETKWEAIWQDAGTKLNEQGKTYVMDDGRWGWDHTMRLSDNDLAIIADAAERNGVIL